jgi:hypothetical protein
MARVKSKRAEKSKKALITAPKAIIRERITKKKGKDERS